MFGGQEGGFNPDLISDRLEDMLPVIQQVRIYRYMDRCMYVCVAQILWSYDSDAHGDSWESVGQS